MQDRASWVGDTRWSGRGSLQGQHDSSMECCVRMRAGAADLEARTLSALRGRVCVGVSGVDSWLGTSNYVQFSEQPGFQVICACPLVSHARRGPETRPCVPMPPCCTDLIPYCPLDFALMTLFTFDVSESSSTTNFKYHFNFHNCSNRTIVN
jgi:hypothetical protein